MRPWAVVHSAAVWLFLVVAPCSALCPAGTYAAGMLCSPCPSGKFKSRLQDKHCSACARGTFSLAGAGRCARACPSGHYGSADGVCHQCPRGKFTPAKTRGTCIGCELGRWVDKKKRSCFDLCASGSFGTAPAYTPSERDVVCRPCPPGKYQRMPGKGMCNECPPGRFSRQQPMSARGAVACALCDKGMWAPAQSRACKICPPGRYGTGGSRTAACSAECPSGRYGLAGSRDEECTAACPAGRWGSGGSTTSACHGKCPAGRYGYGGSFNSECSGRCAKGRWSKPGARECYAKSTTAPVTRAPSPAPTIAPTTVIAPRTTTSTRPLSHAPSPAPSLAPSPAPSPAPSHARPAATTSATLPQRAAAQDTDHATAASRAPGKSANLGSAFKRDRAPKIAAKLRRSRARTSTAAVSNCASGMYLSIRSGQLVTCLHCPAGRWSRGGRVTECLLCPAGRFGIGASKSGDCSGLCPAGRYGIGGETSSLCHGACPPGRYGSAGSSSPQCDGLCPAGRFGRGGSGSNICDGPCPPGTRSNAGAAKCVKCPRGRFASTGQACHTCQLGRAQSKPGSAFCVLCDRGKVSSLARDKCESCPAGWHARMDKVTLLTHCTQGTKLSAAKLPATTTAVTIVDKVHLRATVKLQLRSASPFDDQFLRGEVHISQVARKVVRVALAKAIGVQLEGLHITSLKKQVTKSVAQATPEWTVRFEALVEKGWSQAIALTLLAQPFARILSHHLLLEAKRVRLTETVFEVAKNEAAPVDIETGLLRPLAEDAASADDDDVFPVPAGAKTERRDARALTDSLLGLIVVLGLVVGWLMRRKRNTGVVYVQRREPHDDDEHGLHLDAPDYAHGRDDGSMRDTLSSIRDHSPTYPEYGMGVPLRGDSPISPFRDTPIESSPESRLQSPEFPPVDNFTTAVGGPPRLQGNDTRDNDWYHDTETTKPVPLPADISSPRKRSHGPMDTSSELRRLSRVNLPGGEY